MDANTEIIRRHNGDNRKSRSQFRGSMDIFFDGNRALKHPQWRDKLLVHELARYCSDQH